MKHGQMTAREEVRFSEQARHREAGCFVHPLANVEGSTIGARTKVWQFASVIRGARIGEDCVIASCAIVDGAYLCNRVLVGHGGFIDPGALIGNDVFIGPGAKLCNDAWPRVSKENFDLNRLLSGALVTTIIHDGASLGAGVIVLPGLVIGAAAMISAGAVVTKSVQSGWLWTRDGRQVKINDEGISLAKRMREAKA